MKYQISDKDFEEISLFIPSWFIKAILAEENLDVVHDKLQNNLLYAHKAANRKISPFELKEKTDDLYETYLDTLKEYETKDQNNGSV